ncbi:hypothetical protein D3C84_1041630 [compost metagenome]
MQGIVARACAEYVVAIARIEGVVTVAGNQHIVPGGAGQGMARLIADIYRRAVTATVVVTGGIAAVVIRGFILRPRIVNGHGQLIVFRRVGITAAGIGDVGDVDLVVAIRCRGERSAIVDRNEWPAVE